MKTVLFLLACLGFMSVSFAEDWDSDSESDSKDTKEEDANYKVTDEAWFDIEIKDYPEEGEDYKGRFTIGLFGDVCPMTILNFKSLVQGFKRGKKTLTYRKSPIHRIVRDFIIQMGDSYNRRRDRSLEVKKASSYRENSHRNGCVPRNEQHSEVRPGESIFGAKFGDENHIISHKAAGYVSMANHGPDSNGSQFFITLLKTRWLDGKHVAFGKVVSGMDVVRTLGEVPANANTAVPKNSIRIIDCGLNTVSKPYTLKKKEAESDDDL
ncbi:hypothetical protein FSP39_018394 [Pinctada imbricata]|uniref:Peptidyl-prolyl cis-trans isomerase n=1 Tax=Pinctada imbricata TaxID=66713 RepID=A0AA89BW24_PINIB|nr:hypothetical protein FSP39_018394 [Pinctada imbricata]